MHGAKVFPGQTLEVGKRIKIRASGSDRMGTVNEVSKSGKRALVTYTTNNGATSYTKWLPIEGVASQNAERWAIETPNGRLQHLTGYGTAQKDEDGDWVYEHRPSGTDATFGSKGAATGFINKTVKASTGDWSWGRKSAQAYFRAYGDPAQWTPVKVK